MGFDPHEQYFFFFFIKGILSEVNDSLNEEQFQAANKQKSWRGLFTA